MPGTKSTAGAVPVLNQKGEITMQKVKVQRYVSGRRPDYAEGPSDDENGSDNEFNSRSVVTSNQGDILPHVIDLEHCAQQNVDQDEQNDIPLPEEMVKSDRRLQRLMNRAKISEDRSSGRKVADPEIIAFGDSSARRRQRQRDDFHESEDDVNDGSDEESVAKRHELIRKTKQEEEEELLGRADDEEEEEESEYEECSDSDDDAVPRLKPIFVRKDDRVTVKEREILEQKEKAREELALREAEKRRQDSLKMIEDEVKREEREKAEKEEDEALAAAIEAIDTEDEADQDASYEIWKLRELKRIKREKDEREAHDKEEEEKERLRKMSEEERQAELEKNPRIITNQAEKGKYKFMQKYFHRGAFYLDEDNSVFKRNFAEPTLEDHFDKTVLPKVMQVKNFGKAGRTKYTHLVDQDTTAHDGPWAAQTAQSQKFVTSLGGGFKPIFERPSKKRKT